MSEDKWAKIDKLYELVIKSKQATQPKHVLFSWKCPKCSGKLNKETVKEIVFLGDSGGAEGSEVVKKIMADTKSEPGVYNLSINRFSCNCGYEYASANIDPMEE